MGTSDNRRYWYIYSLTDVIFITVLAFVFLREVSMLKGGDVAFHIKVGQHIIENLSIPSHDIFTHSATPLPWTPPSWLADIVFALAEKPFGLTGVVVFTGIVIAAIFAILFNFIASSGVRILVAAPAVLLAAMVSMGHWLPRPHILALLLLLLWYIVLDTYQYKMRSKLWLLPVLTVLWVNIHGSFVLGFLLSGTYIVGNLFVGWFQREEHVVAFKRARTLALYFVLCLAVALLNPQGIKILLSPFQSLANGLIASVIVEWQSPSFHSQIIYGFSLLSLVALLGWSGRRLTIIETMLLLVFTGMSLYAVRFIPLYAVIVGPIAARELDHLVDQRRGWRVFRTIDSVSGELATINTKTKGNLWSFLAVAVVVVLCATGELKYEFDRTQMPVDAVEFLKQEPIPGQMFNRDIYGSYLLYAAWPQYDPFIDGRYLGSEERLRDYIDATSARRNWEMILEKYGIGWILFKNESALSNLLMESDNWHLIYSDPVANVFVKRIPENEALIQKYAHITRSGTDVQKGVHP
jgi:MFS family permease